MSELLPLRENAFAVQQLLARASDLHQRGQLTAAAPLYQQVLDAIPDQFEAGYQLGVLRSQQGDHDAALALIAKALRAKPDMPGPLMTYGIILTRTRRFEEALAGFDRALAISPGFVQALVCRGNVLQQLERHADALASYDRAIAIVSDDAAAFYNRGNALVKLGRRDEALASYRTALSLRPNDVDTLINSGNVLVQLGRYEEAVASFGKVIELRRDHIEALNNLGNAFRKLERYDESLATYERLLAIRPDDAEALYNRGITLHELKRFDDALASYQQALAAQPDHAKAFNNLGNVFLDLDRNEAALASFERALTIRPDFGEALNNRGLALLKLVRPQEALASIRRALASEPSAAFHSNLIFTLNFDPAADTAALQAERARWDALHAQPLAASIRPHGNDRDPERRLRIGYVSSHFRHQAATYAFGGVVLHHDPRACEVVCYSDTVETDDVTARLRAGVELWRDTRRLSDEALAERIREDRIDILVDVVGHMSGHRLLVFARKPAPIQVTAWGEPTGTGLKAMDYLFADPVLVPERERALLAERVIDLPGFLGYWTPDPLPEPSGLPALARGYVTFGSFNRAAKVQDPVLRSWAAILRALPSARLVIKGYQDLADGGERSRIDAVLGQEGIAAERMLLRDRRERSGHFADYQEIDIALDPFPHGGGMTTLDALWMGVPVVTFTGRTISSRLAAASLTALELTDFIAADRDAYVALAIAKAGDLAALARLRATLRARLAASAIGDPKRYAQAVEAAYRAIWRRWCAGDRGATPLETARIST